MPLYGLSDGESYRAIVTDNEMTGEEIRNPFVRFRDPLSEQDFVGPFDIPVIYVSPAARRLLVVSDAIHRASRW